MTTATDNSRIIDKIRKCLAMANDSRGNASEAANAMRQAQALMAKHNITEMGVEASEISEDGLRSKVSVKNPMAWEWQVMHTACTAFGCKPVFMSGGPEPTNKGYFRIIGVKHNVEIAIYTATVLMRQVLKARVEYVKTLDNYARADKSKLANAFCLAWAHEVRGTVMEFADDGSNKRKIEAYLELKVPGVVKMKPKGTALYAGAAEAGREAAAGVKLFRGTGTNAPLPQLK